MTVTFERRFQFLPSLFGDWLSNHGGVTGKAVLDFGCGDGITAAGIAHALQPRSILGVDINREHVTCAETVARHCEGADLSALSFETIAPDGEIPASDLDLVFSWSTFEHIDQVIFEAAMSRLYRSLKVGGFCFFQVAPLYYSPEGGHLWELGYRNWEHLTKQLSHIERDLQALPSERGAALWSMFSTLNKATSDHMLGTMRSVGFELIREYRSEADAEPPPDLLSRYQRDVLKGEQIVALLKRPS